MQVEPTLYFPAISKRSGICVADGYGVEIFVRNGRLIVRDGVADERRDRAFSRSTHGLRRLVVRGHSGFVSLEAFRWCADVGIFISQIALDGRILSASGISGLDDARLRRGQANALSTGPGMDATRYLLRLKIEGQRNVLTSLDAPAVTLASIDASLNVISDARSFDAMRNAEASAANSYWNAWSNIPIRFAQRDKAKRPENWRTFDLRSSPLTGSPRTATNPANAILNYLYSLAEIETRFACLAVGLDPGIGLLHADQRARDSLCLDLLEPVRPRIDQYVLAMLLERVFRLRDFFETRKGVCRLLPPLTHELAETMPQWQSEVAPIAETVAGMLAAPRSRAERRPTPLTQTNRSIGRDAVRRQPRRAAPKPKIPFACLTCGLVLENRERKYCDQCGPEQQKAFEAGGGAAIRRAWAEGKVRWRDWESAKRKVGERNALRQREARSWNAEHGRPDPAQFRLEILPGLDGVPLKTIASVTGLSKQYAGLIRRGSVVPNSRHWSALRGIARNADEGTTNH